MLMSDGIKQVEFLVGDIRRRRWTVAQKLALIEESFAEGESVSSVAHRHGVAPNLLYRWRRLLQDGGEVAVGCDSDVVC